MSESTSNADAPASPTKPPVEYDILRLMGRCSNGFEADAGELFHAVLKKSFPALCKAKPGKRSAGWSTHEGKLVTCPRCRRLLGMLPLQVERAIKVLTGAGFVPDGATREEAVRIPTSRAPVHGRGAYGGGELRTLGGRTRFALPDSGVRATVGTRTICVYQRNGRDFSSQMPTILGTFDTNGFTVEQLSSVLASIARTP